MNYKETTSWMFSRLPMYQRRSGAAYKEDLSRTITFVKQLNYPERKFKSVHVGGTNGKGSTAHMIASVLQEAGYKVELYTSPHLIDFRERIKINGAMISEQFVVEFIVHQKSFGTKPAFIFEMTVGMAFSYFEKKMLILLLWG